MLYVKCKINYNFENKITNPKKKQQILNTMANLNTNQVRKHNDKPDKMEKVGFVCILNTYH